MYRRRTKKALNEAKDLTRIWYHAQLAFIVLYAGSSLVAPWPKLSHIEGKIAPFWELKLALFAVLFVGAIGFRSWYIRYGYKVEHLIWWKWVGVFLISFLPVLIAVICALEGAKSVALGLVLVIGWSSIILDFVSGRLRRWNDFYRAMIAKGKIDEASGEMFPDVINPSLSELDKELPTRKANLAGGTVIGAVAVLGVGLSGPLLASVGNEAEIMNAIWMGLHYLLACLLAPLPAFVLFEVLLIYRWKRENGQMPFLGSLAKKV